jgi:DNA-binding CsgD family transcriptional regulator
MVDKAALLRHAELYGVEGIEEMVPALGLTAEEAILFKVELNEAVAPGKGFREAARMDLTPDERAVAARAMKRLSHTDGKIAQRLGVKPSQIKRLLRRAEELASDAADEG